MAISKSFLAVANSSVFNPSEWKPASKKYTLEEICNEGALGFNYKDIEGEEAEISETEFSDGSTTLRIVLNLKDGQEPELKAGKGIQDNFDDGDKVKVGLIYGQMLHKAGQDDIIRYDVWKSEEEKDAYLKERGAE